MSTAITRGIILFQQSRYDLADREFRRELADEPDNPMAHAFLALCLAQRNAHDEAMREADEAIRLDPGQPFCHHVRGAVLAERGKYKEAQVAVEEAIRLDPMNAEYLGLLANIEFHRRHWAEALDAAGRGLALDPEHAVCTNLRAMALVQLGRGEEAAETLGSALANDPENALTHANQGWALLHRGDHVRALEHFREALRLDPELEWARVGIVEALKARYFVYRVMLRFFLWMGRQSSAAQWLFILGFIFGRQMLAALTKSHPALEPVLTPLILLSSGFLLLTWISSPLFNLLLRLNRFGRLALSRDERVASSWIGACFIFAVGAFVAYLIDPHPARQFPIMYFGLLLLPLAVTFTQAPGRPRWLMAASSVIVALLGLPLMSLIVFVNRAPTNVVKLSFTCFDYFVWGAILSTWLSALFGRRTRSR
jgi:tetratricopeptide (TPR) repeat protein